MKKNPFERIPMKRTLSVLLVMALAVPVFWMGNPFSPTLKASADTYRKGYALAAEKADRTGIFPDTTFLLTVPDAEIEQFSGTGDEVFRTAHLQKELEDRLQLRNPPKTAAVSENPDAEGSPATDKPEEGTTSTTAGFSLSIEPAGRGTFRVTPSQSLAPNSLYFFDMTASDGEVIPFAFQTRKEYGIVGTLPANQNSSVPVDTGIEVYFSHPGVTLENRYFEISPAVDGRFETHGNVVAFVPRKPLATGTLYTVTIKAGLPLPGTEETLAADLSFSFETSPDEGESANPDQGWLSIGNGWLEFPTSEKPVLPFNLSLPSQLQTDGKAELSISVYRYGDVQSFVKALEQRDEVPYWAWWSYTQNLLSTEGLAAQLSYKQPIDFNTMPATWTELPEALPAGFYLVELQAGAKDAPLKAQALLQVTDTAAWFIEDKTQTLFWVNSLRTGQPLSGLTVESLLTGSSGTTDKEGLASLARMEFPEEKSGRPEYFLLRDASGAASVYFSGYPVFTAPGEKMGIRPYSQDQGNYWKYAGTDRTLYKPSDTVHFWGFARSRTTGESPRSVTVELAQGGWMYPWMDMRSSYWMPMIQKPLMTLALPADNGFWDGSLALPNLETGYYTLSVKSGDEVISTSGFSVENYVKPAWQITATTDKNAVEPGETVLFTIKAAFFDGTPVANQSIRYNLWEPNEVIDGEGKTDANGELRIPYKAKYFDGQQGEWLTSLNATAELPETGEVSASANVRVFLNDIWVDTTGEMVNADGTEPLDRKKDRIGRVTANVHQVNLIPLNDTDLENDGEFRGAAVSGQVFLATVTRTTWERVETGEDYDFVNKVVIPRYEYREKREVVSSGTFTSDADGKTVYEFPVPAGEEGHYTTEITTVDGRDHKMTFQTWHSDTFRYPGEGIWYNLKTDKEAYRAGDRVTASLQRSDEAPLSGKTLFVTSWQGIHSSQVTDGTTFETVFREEMAPNLTLDAVLFDGKSYQATQNSIRYDAEEKRIAFEITTDRDNYRPGDTVIVTIKGTDVNGKPVPATLNVSLVDEALLKLSDQYTNVLETLYGWMDNGIVRRPGNNIIYPMAYGMRGGFGGDAKLEMAFSESAEMPMPSAADMATNTAPAMVGGAEDAYVVRSDFRDTAYFAMTTLDETGTGQLTFTLPDNITDWRVTVSGISNELHGGNGTASTVVSLPFFLNETVNATYLAGDEPQIGLTAYGTSLKEDETVTFTLTSPELPSLNETVTAKAFERAHLAVGPLKEGTYTFLLKAKSASGLTDAVERTVTVVGTYQEMQKSVQAKLVNGMTIPTGTKGLTRIAVTDPERAALLATLHSLAWRNGHRLDQRLVASSAQRWLNELMRQADKDGSGQGYGLYDPETVDTASYQREDGGFGILPYAESDVRLTALLAGLLSENGGTESLKAWLYGKVYAGDNAPTAALYGLAVLGEPVLTELQRAATVRNMTPEDTLFLILGYAAVGDLPAARALWDADIAPLLEKADPYVRVKAPGYDKDESLQLTALASAAAASLRLTDADGLHAWVANNGSKNVFTGIEDLMWVKARFQTLPKTELSFTWTYAGKANREVLANGQVAFITVPSLLAGELRISEVSGDGQLTSTFTAPLEGVGTEKGVSLRRKYYNQTTGKQTNTFRLNDLVRVELTWNISADAMDGVYEISDWLPAGLAPVDNPWQYGIRPPDSFWYRSFEGQQVDFVVGREWNLTHTITYYARVTSPGAYTAEGAVMRGSMVRDSMLAIPSDRIAITTK